MPRPRQSIICYLTVLLILASPVTLAQQNLIVIDNNVVALPDNSVTVPVVGIRPAIGLFYQTQYLYSLGKYGRGDISVPTAVIIASALRNPEIHRILKNKHKDLSNLTLQKLVNAIKGELNTIDDLKSRKHTDKLAKFGNTYIDKYQKLYPATISMDPRCCGRDPDFPFQFDPNAITNMLVAGLIDVSSEFIVEIAGHAFKSAPIYPEFQEILKRNHGILQHIKFFTPHDIAYSMKNIHHSFLSDPKIGKSLLLSLGNTTFGTLVPKTAKEMDLVLSQSVEKRFDVYWIEFVVTFRELPIDQLDELSLNISLPEKHVALELVPLRFGITVDVEENVSAPDISVKAGDIEVSVGQLFSKTVNYRFLEPTITAFGLRENEFSWALRDKAISAGSHRFIAVVGVPKGASSMAANVSVFVKTKNSFLVDGDVASTLPQRMVAIF